MNEKLKSIIIWLVENGFDTRVKKLTLGYEVEISHESFKKQNTERGYVFKRLDSEKLAMDIKEFITEKRYL